MTTSKLVNLHTGSSGVLASPGVLLALVREPQIRTAGFRSRNYLCTGAQRTQLGQNT